MQWEFTLHKRVSVLLDDIPTLHSEQLKIKFKTTSQLCKEAGLAGTDVSITR